MAKLHRHKIAFVSSTLTTIQFSAQNTEQKKYWVPNISTKITLLHQNKENSEKKQTQKRFFTVTDVDAHDTYWNFKI